MRLVLAVAAASLLFACAPKEAPVSTPAHPSAPAAKNGGLPAPTPASVTQRITAADNGRTIDVAPGGRFAVELVGVPTAGYLWGVTQSPAFLSDAEERSGDTTKAQSQPGFAGGNHWEVFVFTAAASGEGKLRLEQRRPWEKTEPPAQTFEVTVRVR